MYSLIKPLWGLHCALGAEKFTVSLRNRCKWKAVLLHKSREIEGSGLVWVTAIPAVQL